VRSGGGISQEEQERIPAILIYSDVIISRVELLHQVFKGTGVPRRQ